MVTPKIFPCGHPYSAMRSVLDMQCGICNPAPKTFGCGHPRTPENTVSSGPGRVRCKVCRKKPEGATRISVRELSDEKLWERQIRVAARSLLEAIHRDHPYVIIAAINDGRI